MKTNIQELERALDICMYWLLRAHDSGHREGWEPGPNVNETMTAIHSVLCNAGIDPCKRQAATIRKMKPAYWHDEITLAAYRVFRAARNEERKRPNRGPR